MEQSRRGSRRRRRGSCCVSSAAGKSKLPWLGRRGIILILISCQVRGPTATADEDGMGGGPRSSTVPPRPLQRVADLIRRDFHHVWNRASLRWCSRQLDTPIWPGCLED